MTPEEDSLKKLAKFGFFLETYERGDTENERDSDIARLMLQTKGNVHYDRDQGGGFEELEQEPNDEGLFQKFRMNAVESIFRLNESKRFDPFVVVGVRDLTVESERKDKTSGPARTRLVVNITHRTLNPGQQAKRLSLRN